MIVIDKPPGLPVHAGPGGGPNLEQFFDALRFGLPRPPALAHRLDRDTSGCLVLGRHPKALRGLGRLCAEGRVEKTYWALGAGRPPQDEGRIDRPLAKIGGRAGWRMRVDPAGQPAVTDYRVLAADDSVSWLELKPRTGRTHQIRVHCAALGCPVLGDDAYGTGAAAAAGPLQLHARAVAVPLYPNRPPVAVEAPPPPHMVQALAEHGFAVP
ncbi:MAG: RNA pseudouridine synthase [Rhodospirillaceae bacterium]|nr:RNA pseudouridine synthase [Rhodospirillaceae bacterium]